MKLIHTHSYGYRIVTARAWTFARPLLCLSCALNALQLNSIRNKLEFQLLLLFARRRRHNFVRCPSIQPTNQPTSPPTQLISLFNPQRPACNFLFNGSRCHISYLCCKHICIHISHIYGMVCSVDPPNIREFDSNSNSKCAGWLALNHFAIALIECWVEYLYSVRFQRVVLTHNKSGNWFICLFLCLFWAFNTQSCPEQMALEV